MSAKKQMYYVGFCRICRTGPLGLRECGSCDSVVVLCDECDATWSGADFSVTPQFASEGKLTCPHCQASLLQKPSRWATQGKIHNVAWLQEALQQGRLKLMRGTALAPDIGDPDSPKTY